MKASFFIFLIICLFNTAFSKEAGTYKISRKQLKTKLLARNKNPFKNAPTICKQKSIPMKVEQTLNASLLTVSFSAEQKIDNFSLKNVRGIDGVKVSKFQELLNQKLDRGEVIEANVELEDFEGLVYVVFDVAVTINGLSRDYSIPVALGTLSAAQVSERSKNIKEVKVKSQQKDGINSQTAPAKKIHEMQLE